MSFCRSQKAKPKLSITFPIHPKYSDNHFKVITMVSVFCISWGPYALLSIIGILGHSEVRKCIHFSLETFDFLMIFQDIPLYLTVFPVQLAKSSILWNPLIYICMNKSVRRTLKEFLLLNPLFNFSLQFQQSFQKFLRLYFPNLWCLKDSAFPHQANSQQEDQDVTSAATFSRFRKSFKIRYEKS